MNANEMIALAERLSTSYDAEGTYLSPEGQHSDGLYRSVLLRGGFAFKAVKRAKDRDCIAEWDFYCMTTDEIRAHLAKPVYVSRNGNVVVMERLEVCSYGAHGSLVSGLETDLTRLCKETYGFNFFCDFGCRNSGMTSDGRCVVIDWGNMLHRFNEKRGSDSRDYERAALAEILLTSVVK